MTQRPTLKSVRGQFLLLIVCVSVFARGQTAMAQDDGDVIVGVSGSGQLKITEFIPDDEVVLLPPVSGLFNGWADSEPGFDHVVDADEENDIFPMASGAQIRLQAVNLDPALRAISPSFVVVDAAGEQMLLGNQNLHSHVTWNVNSDDPNFDPDKTLWRGTFKLVDTGSTGYGESAPFTFYFVIVDCLTGDVNEDTFVDGRDVQAFVDVLLNPGVATLEQRCAADANLDGYATIDDVSEFVAMLIS